MSDITLYGLKNCDTCKKARLALEATDRTLTFVDIRAEADLARLVPVWLKAVGEKALVNTRSTTWRSLDETERGLPALTLLTRHPTLIKRPVIDAIGAITIGWTKDVQAALL